MRLAKALAGLPIAFLLCGVGLLAAALVAVAIAILAIAEHTLEHTYWWHFPEAKADPLVAGMRRSLAALLAPGPTP